MRGFILLAALLLPLPLAAQGAVTLPTAFPSLSFSSPIELTTAPGDATRLYVAEQGGRVVTFSNSPTTSASTVYLSLAGLLSSGGERGLLGLAFHPDYAANGYVYVHYSGAGDGRTVLARYTRSAANPLAVDPASAQVLLQVPQPFSNHNGGKLAFGPDGYLYLSLGDGGSAGDPGNRSQNRTVLLGKLLRIDVDASTPGGLPYGIPADNPYAGNTQGFREEIFAYGLRNMWKFAFDRETGRLWGADVGQGSREEVNWIENGGNYGWRIMEGTLCYNPSSGCNQAGLTLPVYEYSHAGGACSITGGTVYRGAANPGLVGRYLYADYCVGAVSALTVAGNGSVSNQVLAQAGFGVIGFGEDAAGEMYVLSSGSGANTIRRIVETVVAGTGTPDAPGLALRPDGPSPFGEQTAVTLTADGPARVVLVDALGRTAAVLFEGPVAAGRPVRIDVDGRRLAPGVYVVRAESGDETATLRLVHAR